MKDFTPESLQNIQDACISGLIFMEDQLHSTTFKKGQVQQEVDRMRQAIDLLERVIQRDKAGVL